MPYWLAFTEFFPSPDAEGGNYMNGILEQTIYDSSGRYRGFAHIPRQMHVGVRQVNIVLYHLIATNVPCQFAVALMNMNATMTKDTQVTTSFIIMSYYNL